MLFLEFDIIMNKNHKFFSQVNFIQSAFCAFCEKSFNQTDHNTNFNLKFGLNIKGCYK